MLNNSSAQNIHHITKSISNLDQIIVLHGLQDKIEAVFDEIQRSNMSKLGEDGQPIYREDGKVMKGPNYFKPDFSKLL